MTKISTPVGAGVFRDLIRGRVVLLLPTTTMLLLLLLLCLPSFSVFGQQVPSIHIVAHSDSSNQTFRQNFCHRQDMYARGQVDLRHALEGEKINAAVMEGIFFLQDPQTGAIRQDYPGLMATLMDELALRAGFTWRDSFGTYPPPALGSNHSWTDLLYWMTDNFDISVEWWASTLERLSSGVVYVEGWYDNSYILVGVDLNKNKPPVNLKGWLEPFSAEVWGMIVVTIIVSGCLYFVLELIGNPERYDVYQSKQETLINDLYFSALLFTQHFQFHPRSPGSRVFAVSMAMWALLLSSTYTANLASYFVIENTPSFKVETIEDAVETNLPLCVWEGTASASHVARNFPKARLVPKGLELDLYEALLTGECALSVVGRASFMEFRNNKQANPTCSLEWVGRTIKHSPAGFAMAGDAGTKCTSLVHDVIDLHLVEMKLEGFIERAWDEHLSRSQSINCTGTETKEQSSRQRTLEEMAGTFVLHLIFCGVAVVMAVSAKLWRWLTDAPNQNDVPSAAAGRPANLHRGGSPKNGMYHMTNDPTPSSTAHEIETSFQRRQDEMEARVQLQLQQIQKLLKIDCNPQVNADDVTGGRSASGVDYDIAVPAETASGVDYDIAVPAESASGVDYDIAVPPENPLQVNGDNDFLQPLPPNAREVERHELSNGIKLTPEELGVFFTDM